MARRISIAVVYSGINSEYQDKILQGIVDTAKLKKYNVGIFAPLSNTTSHSLHDSGENKIFDLINYELFDALIILPSTIHSQEITDKILSDAHKAGVPVVSIDRKIGGCHSIELNYSEGFSRLIEHLIVEHNARKLNYIGAFENEIDSDQRFLAFRKTLKKFGIPYEHKRVCFAEYDEYKAIVKLRQYLDDGNHLPDAFVCANDSMAIGICDELGKRGYRVPQDVIVTGFDGIRYASGHVPSVTTVKVSYYKAGESAVAILGDLLRLDKGEFVHAEIKNDFVLGGSCGCGTDDSNVHNDFLHSLNSENDRFTTFSKRLVQMSEDLTFVTSFDAAFHKLKYYFQDIYVDRIYLCLNSHFETPKNKLADVDCTEYTDQITVRVSREYGAYRDPYTIDKSDIVPGLLDEGPFSNVFFVTPLHFQDRNFGYLALSCDGYIGSNTLFNTWKMNVCTALENVRIKTEQSIYANMLERMYIRDPLTNLLNRRGLFNKANELFEISKKRRKPVFVFTADLDNLKIINDRFGHHEGDNAIIQVGNILNRISRHRELCSRFGGDEFEVMAFSYTKSLAQEFVDELKRSFDEYNKTSGKPYIVAVSVGMYVAVPDSDSSLEDFIRQADSAMYSDKQNRKKAGIAIYNENSQPTERK